MAERNGGGAVADVLRAQGVRFLFTLCGGHISPILVESKARGIHVVDVRDEATAVFAADAVARLTGVPGVAAVTAGPGVTNTITAVKNAQMAQSPVVLFGGAAPTVLSGRGALQDIDHMSVMQSLTKETVSVKTLAAIEPTLRHAFELAAAGVPGPVFVEIPVDLLYDESTIREWYRGQSGVGQTRGLGARALELYLRGHLYRQFHAPHLNLELSLPEIRLRRRPTGRIDEVADEIRRAERPVLVVGSQALVGCRAPERVAGAVERLGIPTYLGGMARGLLGRASDIQFRHKRSNALKAADLVVVAGFPFDFRLNYGRSINSRATVVAANLSATELHKNRRPEIAIKIHPGDFLEELSSSLGDARPSCEAWFGTLREREAEREREITEQAAARGERVNPLDLFRRLDAKLADDSLLVADGGDFVATASYILRPRGPLRWLDPGVFGTLGVGGGFALGAALCRPESETWLIYGDGACAYSLAEFDTYVRHGRAPIALIGNDGAWAQIAREQVELLGDDVGTVLRRTDYHRVVEGYGGVGLLLDDPDRIDSTLERAQGLAREGKPVAINVHLEPTRFRKGSISM